MQTRAPKKICLPVDQLAGFQDFKFTQTTLAQGINFTLPRNNYRVILTMSVDTDTPAQCVCMPEAWGPVTGIGWTLLSRMGAFILTWEQHGPLCTTGWTFNNNGISGVQLAIIEVLLSESLGAK